MGYGRRWMRRERELARSALRRGSVRRAVKVAVLAALAGIARLGDDGDEERARARDDDRKTRRRS